MRADAQAEEEQQIHEIDVLYGELDNINAQNEDKAARIEQLKNLINSLRAQIDDAESKIRDLMHQLRSNSHHQILTYKSWKETAKG